MGKYSDVKWEKQEIENGVVVHQGTPVPKEIVDYYMKHGYANKGIPLNADICREIAELL